MGAAYVIADTRVKDKTLLDRYRVLAQPSVLKFGGEYLATGPVEVLAGAWQPPRLSIVRFADLATARAWWNSADYKEARDLRLQFPDSTLFIVEGL